MRHVDDDQLLTLHVLDRDRQRGRGRDGRQQVLLNGLRLGLRTRHADETPIVLDAGDDDPALVVEEGARRFLDVGLQVRAGYELDSFRFALFE